MLARGVAGLITCTIIAFARPVGAQERTVTGLVTDSVNGRPVRDAIAYFGIQRAEVKTGRDGRFTIPRVSAGDTVLVIRGIGYVPLRMTIGPAVGTVDVGSVPLRPVATPLDQIAVETEAVERYPQLERFYVRKQTGRAGDFLTPEIIEQSRVTKTSELLYRSAKVEVNCLKDPVRNGQEGCAVRDRRGPGYRVIQGNTERCNKEIFVDGRLSALTLDEIQVSEIAGVEIYAGPATTPAEFGQRRCGVIAIWTKGARLQ